ncbi:hypothetical protein [Roseateles sp.]|uniref:hypothetical protein n=1 Tax=Roseateles sp. TaxID=1971397 RepID=UPI003BAB11E2
MKSEPSTITVLFGGQEVVLPLAVARKKWDVGNASIEHILHDGLFMPLLESENLPGIRKEWRRLLGQAIQAPPGTQELSMAFHTQWHVCHHRLRELIDDDSLLLELAETWLPRYTGPDLHLYRGENIDRFESGRIGSAWSDKLATAELFAGSQNNAGKGGVVLRAKIPASAIIAGPSAHSLRMDESEYTVDTRRLDGIEEVKRFPPGR